MKAANSIEAGLPWCSGMTYCCWPIPDTWPHLSCFLKQGCSPLTTAPLMSALDSVTWSCSGRKSRWLNRNVVRTMQSCLLMFSTTCTASCVRRMSDILTPQASVLPKIQSIIPITLTSIALEGGRCGTNTACVVDLCSVSSSVQNVDPCYCTDQHPLTAPL